LEKFYFPEVGILVGVEDAPYPKPSIKFPNIKQNAGIAAPNPDAAIIPAVSSV
jgi:hypothetical protein